MLLSIALIALTALALGLLFQKIRIPAIVAMILTGVLYGPAMLNLIDPTILSLSSDLRKIALVVILLRAGMSLRTSDFKKIGKPAIWMSFLPATVEIIIVALLGHWLFELPWISSFLLGSVVAAVSLAVVVPAMIQLIEQKRGTEKSIPQLLLGAVAIDNVFVLVVFSMLLDFSTSGSASWFALVQLPISILLGAAIGAFAGYVSVWVFRKLHLRDTVKTIVLISIALLFVELEKILQPFLPFSSLMATISMGIVIKVLYPVLSERLSLKFSKLWVGAEIMLFVLVGAIVNLNSISNVFWMAFLILLVGALFHGITVVISLHGSSFTNKEKVFSAFAYLPKATMQAAVGAIPLEAGVPGGEIILSVALIAILLSAPTGALLTDLFSQRWLKTESIH